MSLENQLREDMKQALKSGEKDKLTTLRTTISQVKDERIRLMRDLTDADVITVLTRAVKSRKDSIEMYQKGNRQDLVDKETKELEVIQAYLPEQMSEDDVKKELVAIIEATGANDAKDIGKVMGQAMSRLKGKADGKLVQQLARTLLSS
ncbi:MAG: GatB/YqeY domain-containing protein [Calditrichae bacterium]|nr:GatB/YqeY domain-containing protein [Calditrichota bacterium]MCB9057134.1 GatB/YqeY domain-containing protein [Calditrichia bacterium]